MLRYFAVGAKADDISTMGITKGDHWVPAHRLLRSMIRILCEGKNMVLHRPTNLSFEASGIRYAVQKIIRPKDDREVTSMVRAEPLVVV